MEKRAFRSKLCRSIVLLLPIILVLGVLPCEAQEPPTLQDLIDGKTIQVDNLTFSGFKLDGQPFSYPTGDEPQAADITVEVVGRGTTAPGLKFTPNFQVAVEPGSGTARFFLKTISFSYQVNADEGSGLIKGSVLILNPGTVEAAGDYAAAKVEDRGDPLSSSDYLAVMRETQESDSSGVYIITDTLQAETEFPPQATVSPSITVGLSVYHPGGKASIESFEHRLSLVPPEGRPVANAGPDQTVADLAKLDGSKSDDPDGQIVTYLWKLKHRENSEFDREAVGSTPEVSDLEPGFYDVELMVTDNDEYTATDTMLLAASGPSGAGTEPKIQENAELNLWNFELKKYKYCKWSTARMLGTFDLPDDFEFNRGDDLVGKVTVQINRGEEPLVVMSDDLKLKVKNWKYKSVIHGH
jgi:hypothetical protein